MAWGHKYKAKRTERDGFKFPSQKEARFYDHLKDQKDRGEVLFFLMQVPIHICAKAKYVADFLVFYPDGSCEFVDVKGYDTPLSKTKREIVSNQYPFEIKIV